MANKLGLSSAQRISQTSYTGRKGVPVSQRQHKGQRAQALAVLYLAFKAFHGLAVDNGARLGVDALGFRIEEGQHTCTDTSHPMSMQAPSHHD